MEIDKKPRIRTQVSATKVKLETLPSRSVSKGKTLAKQRISTENVRLAQSIMASGGNVKQYKKKMKTEIDEYLRLRTHAQKFKPTDLRPQMEKRPSKTAGQLVALIKQKTEEIDRTQSKVNIALPEELKQSEIEEKEQELLLKR